MRPLLSGLALVLGAVAALGQPLEPADRSSPADLAAFLAGASPTPSRPWVGTAAGERSLVPALPRRSIAAGRGGWCAWWRRTGRPDGPWREDTLGLAAPLPGAWGGLETVAGGAGPRGQAWPWGGRLSWRPRLALGNGWRIGLRWDLFAVRRPWLERAQDLVTVRRDAWPWALWARWGPDRDDRPGLELGVRRRFHATAALEGGKTPSGALYGALIVGRGPLVLRLAQGVHPLLGIWRTWEVGLCGPEF